MRDDAFWSKATAQHDGGRPAWRRDWDTCRCQYRFTEGKAGEGALIGGLTGGVLGSVIGNQSDKAIEAEQNFVAQQNAQALQAVTMDQVIQMTQGGLSEELIVNQIRANGIAYPPGTNDLIILKNNGVSDSVIREMQNISGANGVPVQPICHGVESVPVPVRTGPVIVAQPFPVFGPVPTVYHRRSPVRVPRHRTGLSINFCWSSSSPWSLGRRAKSARK